MSERRRYTKRQKAQAAGIGAVEGVTEAERQTGIPKETIHYWLGQPAFAHLRTTARDQVASEFWVGVQIGVEEVVKGLRSDVPLKDKAAALGVLYDRHALLSGHATSRSETKDITPALDDHEKAALRDAIDEWVKAR
jgi:hypothetical protein